MTCSLRYNMQASGSGKNTQFSHTKAHEFDTRLKIAELFSWHNTERLNWSITRKQSTFERKLVAERDGWSVKNHWNKKVDQYSRAPEGEQAHTRNILLFSTSCSAKPRVLNSPSHRYLAICNATSIVIDQVKETREVKVKLFLNRFWNMPVLWSISVTWATKLCLFLESNGDMGRDSSTTPRQDRHYEDSIWCQLLNCIAISPFDYIRFCTGIFSSRRGGRPNTFSWWCSKRNILQPYIRRKETLGPPTNGLSSKTWTEPVYRARVRVPP